MTNTTDTNQASEDRLRKDIEHIILTWSSEISGQPREKLHPETDQFVIRLIDLIRTEKLKLLAEVRERVVDKPAGNHNADSLLERDVLIYNQATAYLRTELTKLEAEL